MELLELYAGDENTDARWRLTLRGMDLLLTNLGMDVEAKRALVARLRDGLWKDLHGDKALEREISERFRAQRRTMEVLMAPAREREHPLAAGLAALRWRSQRLAPIAYELKALERAGRLTVPLTEIAGSYLHMHANRMLRASARQQELVLYDFLERLYRSQLARSRR